MKGRIHFFSTYIIIFLSIVSCRQQEEIPEGILPVDKMTAVMTDVQLTEAFIQSRGLERNDSTKNIAYSYYKTAFNRNNVTPEQFQKSFEYYSKRLDLISKMYDDVITELNKRQAEESNR